MTRLYIRCPECKDKAFEVFHWPQPGEPIICADVTLLDGSKPDPHSRVTCGSCGFLFRQVPTNIIEEPSDA